MRYLYLLTFIFLAFTINANAQKVGVYLNVQALDINFAEDESADSINLTDYNGAVSFSGNLRIFTEKKWAYRIGAGWKNIEYRVAGNGLETDYHAKRHNFTGILGLEKHFDVSIFDIYPGIYVPITYVGEDKLLGDTEEFFEGVKNGNLHAGLGFLLGVNLKILKVLRVGTEFTIGYERFKQDLSAQIESDERFRIKNFGFGTEVVVGFAF